MRERHGKYKNTVTSNRRNQISFKKKTDFCLLQFPFYRIKEEKLRRGVALRRLCSAWLTG